ncbi:MAG TPA: TMEM175 family protein, partial [Jatrophihabitans sp.]|nr:TMEM175 family protein [Jatrophihabitans sp.]
AGTGRLEAFSDGVFAIAITLLVLDLAVPPRDELAGRSLLHALGAGWPSYFAYLVSFAVIGIIWVNHHMLCGLVRQADRLVLFANLFLLLTVSVIPFPTRLLAEYLTATGDSHVAAAIYSATMLAMSIAFTLLFLAITRDARLLHTPLDRATVRQTLRRFSIGGVFYLVTIGLSFVSAVLTLVVHALLAAYYCFDQLSTARS